MMREQDVGNVDQLDRGSAAIAGARLAHDQLG
jgi:hypothetical protein